MGPKLGQFARDYPAVELEITTDDSRVDLVFAGYDAGIQFGEYIAQDMVAVRVSQDLRLPSSPHPATSSHTQAHLSARRSELSAHTVPAPR
jgi:DNA-binding transcriptional LysR family regulator